MANRVFTPVEGCLKSALERQTAYALSVAHLFKAAFTPTPADPKASYTANECDFTDYTTKTLTAWLDPIYAPLSGFMILSPEVQWRCAADQVVSNDVGGAYFVDVGGVVRQTLVLDTPVPMALLGQGLPLVFQEFFPTGG